MRIYRFQTSTVNIYALVDAFGRPFYVGHSHQLDHRLESHIRFAKSGLPQSAELKNRKIRQLGFEIDIKELECISLEGIPQSEKWRTALIAEDKWIRRLSAEGHTLYNSDREISRAASRLKNVPA